MSQPPPGRLRRTVATAAMLGLCGFVGLATLPDQLVVDDVYICLRYARNLAEGHGYCYTPGDAVNGCTSVTWAALLAALHAVLRIDLLQLAAAVQVVLTALLGWSARRLCGEGTFAPLGWLVAPLVVTRPWVGFCTGMDSFLFLTVAVAAMAIARRGSLGWFGLALALLCLTRPEGVILAAILFGQRASRDRQMPWRAAITAAVPLALWCVYLLWRFGTLVPATGAAKLLHASSGMWTSYGRALLDTALPQNLGLPWLIAAGLGALVLLVRDRALFVLLGLWTLLHNGVAVWSGVPAYPWYYFALFLQVALFAVTGARSLLEALAAGRAPVLLRNVAGFATGAVLLAVAAWSWHGQLRSSMWPADLRPTLDRYFHLGQWLRTNAPPGSSLGTLEVGILGYWSELPIVDFCGLVTPGVAQHVPQREHVRFAIDTLRPTFVIAHRQPGSMETGLPELLAKHYWLVRQLDDCSLSCRLPADAGPFAEALARALPVAAGGTVRVAEPWPAFDRRAHDAALAAHRNGWRLAGPGELPSVVAYPRLDGQWSVVPIGELAPIEFDAQALATWQPGNVASSTVVAGIMEHTAAGDLPFVGSRVQAAGPLVAVRARCRARALDGSALGPGQHATLLWTSSSNALVDPRHGLHVPLPSTEGEFEVEFRLPAQRFPHGEVLEHIYLSPVALRCVFAVLRVELVRY